ncbi:MAG: hypothetical protein WCQ99_15300 [Pseudomonadota bacterium]
MQKKFKKYFWDGEKNLSEASRLQRIIEYASFPDLISYPFDEFKANIGQVNIDRLRTSENRKRLMKQALPHADRCTSWHELFRRL